MTDLSPQGRAHLRKNAQSYGDDVLVDVLDALDAALNERDELRDALVNRIFTTPSTEDAISERAEPTSLARPESSEMLRSGNKGL
ncbi:MULTISPECIES: hypothetical protein [Rhodococcus]|uniref:Uncharacterized protein n=1 Tax=Rhodococcus erythropolis TaxID=1833 RepID=A0A8I1D6P6_RHOER|nr:MULTISPECIES: hypothetical protein [Rhodococcus]MBH5143221.1 hypothetical protein [Rhodococcus erythropolis]MBY6386521.1 hypothetical protein [Rhodococcus erythropolis]